MRLWKHTTCTIKEAVTRLDGVVDSIGAGVIVYFPEPERED